ncbi:MAG: ribosome-associated translation inhibitor RaiA [Oligoflexia bacterium]|nr:ribosome-associated translation inhibitor RaiA [Oligoflexia bacterium]
MIYKFTFKHMEALESIQEYSKHRTEKLMKYALHKEPRFNFIFESHNRHEFQAEIIFDAGGGHFVSKAKESDLYTAIDKAIGKLERQLEKKKMKIQKHHAAKPDFTELYSDIAGVDTFEKLNKKAN